MQQPPPIPREPLDYRGPIGESNHPWRPPVLSAGIAVRVWLFFPVLLLVMMFIVPRMESVFRDFKVELPVLTKLLLHISRVMGSQWLLVIMMGLGFTAVLPIVLTLIAGAGTQSADDYRTRLRWLNVLVLLFGVAVTLAVVLGLFLPLVNLMDAVSGQGTPKK